MNSTKPFLNLFAQNHAGELVPVELVRGQPVPVELADEREPILTEVDRYLDEYAGQRSVSYTRGGGYVLRSWANDITEMECTCVQEVETRHCQAWFNAPSPMPPFDSIELSDHVSQRGLQRGYTERHARDCIENPDHIEKTQELGLKGGLIWKFRKLYMGRTLLIVAEVYKNTCYAITAYWLQ
jgi:hypothetical protein